MLADVQRLTAYLLNNLATCPFSSSVVVSSIFSALLTICANVIEDGNDSVREPMREMAARLVALAESTPEMVEHTMALLSDASPSVKTKQ